MLPVGLIVVQKQHCLLLLVLALTTIQLEQCLLVNETPDLLKVFRVNASQLSEGQEGNIFLNVELEHVPTEID
jgi:hypothetical protein